MDKFYAVYNTRTETFISAWGYETLMDKETAKAVAREHNAAMKPEFQNYTVVTVTFDTEI